MASRKPKPVPAPKVKAPPKKPGPKPFSPSPEQRLEISRLTSVGISDATIAKRLKVSEAALQRQCSEELAYGRNIARAEIAMMLWGAAGKGNVSAMKRISEMQEASGAQASINEDASEHAAREAEEREERAVPQGKKDQQRAAAATAGLGSEWGNDLSPTTQTHGAA